MKRRFLAIVLPVLALGACNAQDATVTSKNSPDNKQSPSPSIQDAERLGPDASRLTSGALKRSVLFSMVSTDFQNTLTQLEGVAFLATTAKTTQAFSFHLRKRGIPYGARVIAPEVLVLSADLLSQIEIQPNSENPVEGPIDSPDGTRRAWIQDGPAIAVLDLASNTTGVVPLHFALAAENVVCPTWDGEDRFYFADLRGSRYSIYRATRYGQNWKVDPFAIPDTEMTGYLCPQVLSTALPPGGGS